MAGIPRVQTQFASYNGFAFNDSAHTTALKIDPVESGDGRTIAYNRWTITIRFELAVGAAGTTDALVLAAITRLTHPGGVLIYRGRGLGNPDINTGVATDLRYGPKPKVLAVELIGAGNAVGITWTVEFAVPNCPGVNNPFGYLELAYKVSHAIDDAGYTVRHTSGYLAMPNNRTAPGSRRALLSADAYRIDVMTDIPPGFQRKGMRFDESFDLSRLDFSWSDHELPVPLPAGVVEASFEDNVGSTAAGMVRWQGSMSGTYRMARGYDFMTGATAFFEAVQAVLNDRNKWLKQNKIPGVVVPTGFNMKNQNRYGPVVASFGFTYTFSCALSELLRTTGMHQRFSPNSLTNGYDLWFASVADSAHHPYGGAKLVWTPFDEPGIVDICEIPRTLTSNNAWLPPRLPYNPVLIGGQFKPPPFTKDAEKTVNDMIRDTFPVPKQDDSWIEYECTIRVESDTGIVHVKKLPTKVPDPKDGTFAENGLVTPAGDVNALKDFKQFAPPWFNPVNGGRLEPDYTNIPGIMRRVDESCVLYLEGHAYRYGYPINPPRLLSVNGVPCVPDSRKDWGEGFIQGIKGTAVRPIHWCYWKLRYVLPSVPPGPLPVPPSPMDKP